MKLISLAMGLLGFFILIVLIVSFWHIILIGLGIWLVLYLLIKWGEMIEQKEQEQVKDITGNLDNIEGIEKENK